MIRIKSCTFICISKFLLYEIMKIFFINSLQKFEGVQKLVIQKRTIFLTKRIPIYNLCKGFYASMCQTCIVVGKQSHLFHCDLAAMPELLFPMMASSYFLVTRLGYF